jgi:hypothetical protein
MSTLPVSGATELVLAQTVPETSVNEIARHLDAGHCRVRIEDRDLSAPPGTCDDGHSFQISGSGTGAWAGFDSTYIAIAVGTNAANGWLFQRVNREGFLLYIKDENIEVMWNGAAWVTSASTYAAVTEWVPNFTSDGEMYIACAEAMTIDQGNAAIGSATITFEKSTTAAPGTFSSTTLPASVQAGAWLKVIAASVSGFVATHLVRTA